MCEIFSPLSYFHHLLPAMNPVYNLTIQMSEAQWCLSYPMSLMYALQSLPERRLGPAHSPLENLATLELHVVSSSPIFDSESWEIFMHRLPNLKHLKVVFIMQGRVFNSSFNLNKKLSLRRCKDCEAKNRVITYSVQQMQYHMFFSSPEYTTPDVVVVYGNTQEMAAGIDGDINSEISYRNMTYNQDTMLVLMDETMELVRDGTRAVNNAQLIDQVVLAQENPLRGSGLSNILEGDPDNDYNNERRYFACLRRK